MPKKTKKKYYQLWCLQNHRYMASGSNSKSLRELKAGLVSYISNDYNENDPDWKKIKRMSVEDICEMWQFEIQTTDEPIEYDN
jgi:hypothetical protein